MAKTVELAVKIADLHEVKAAMRQAAEEINRLRAGIAEIADDMDSGGYVRIVAWTKALRTLLEPQATQDGDTDA